MEHGSAARHIPGPEHPHLQVVKNLPGKERPKSVEAVRAELEAIDAQIAALTAQKEEILLGNSELEQEFFSKGKDPEAMEELAAKQISDETFN